MGVIITKQGIEENSFTWEYYCDTYEDLNSIEQENITIGSYCTLLQGENGVEIYTGDGNHQWVLISPSVGDKYAAEHDGKVILNGNLLLQSDRTINENGTYDTTLNNEINVLIEPRLQNKTVISNGTITHDEDYYGLDQVIVNVPNSYEDEDEDKVVQNGELVEQTSRTITENGTYDTTINNEVIVTTENVYEETDEGKVVKNGELIEQTSYSVDENGTYDTTEYNEVVVEIDNTINLQSKTTTVNGEILPDEGYDGLSQVTVAVEGGATLQTKTITENGTVEPDDGYNGFSEVTVNVSNSYEEEDEGKVVSSGELISQTSTTITENGTYDTTTYNEVVVNGIEVEPLVIEENGTYTAPIGKAYSPVTVNVSGGGAVVGFKDQYIDTGVPANTSALTISMRIMPLSIETSEQPILGAAWSTNGLFFMIYNQMFRFHSRGGVVDCELAQNGKTYDVVITDSAITINGTSYAVSDQSGDNVSASLLIWDTPYAQTHSRSAFALANCTIYNEATKIREFVPSETNGNGYLHDKVNNVDYYSQSLNEFGYI